MKGRSRIGEIAGRTTAECVVICCCCPCGLLNILLLAAVRVPAGLFSRAFRKRTLFRGRRKKKKKEETLLTSAQIGWLATDDDLSKDDLSDLGLALTVGDRLPEMSLSMELSEVEKEAWSKLSCRGFWYGQSGRQEK
ncbi:hypothetical protein KSP39_PZI000476 [Platanthera zijinensis]|uniref:Uncharacterized protein n=1 Tax=Platanthera zijinensis TaxID=2320716 RepID=A0AAP0C127_9ASPA